MLGKGYDEPSVVIERPRTIAERQANGEFVERTIPVFVKFSTSFKAELKNITGSELRVWTYIALSIDEKGTAFPGIRTIADALDISHQTVITAIEGLEKKNLLHVVREGRKHNIYQPSDEYVAIFDKNPTGPKIGTVQKLESSPLDSNQTDGVKGDENLSFITALYEKNIGLVYNAHLADELKEYSYFPREWLERAFKEAADANARNWRYVRKCLDNWKSAGKIAFKKDEAKPKSSLPTYDENGRVVYA